MKNNIRGLKFDVGDREKSKVIPTKWRFGLNEIFLFIALLLINGYVGSPIIKKTNPETEYRLNFIRNMTRDAWNAYIKIEYPNNKVENGEYGIDHTLAQSLSTLWVVNLRAQFEEGKQLLQKEPDFSNDLDLPFLIVHKTVAQYIGSMLSCYALTGDEWFLSSAEKAANTFKLAYDTKGLPYNYVNLSKPVQIPDLSHYYRHSLTELGGSQHLEYHYLGDLTKNDEFHQRNDKIRSILRTISKPQGLYLIQLDYEPPHWSTNSETAYSSLSFDVNGFYMYLIKSYIQSNFTDRESMEMFNQAIGAIEAAEMIVKSNHSDNAFTFVRFYNVRKKSYVDAMSYDSCNLGAMFGLSVWALKKKKEEIEENAQRIKKHLDWAQQLTETCHYVGSRTLTGMVPIDFRIEQNGLVTYSDYVFLSPHLAESYFVLYRLTKDPKYREYAWELVQSIAKYAPMPNGIFHKEMNVDRDNRANCEEDCEELKQPSDFIGSTLKYLYLTFTDDEDVLPLDQWVFNRAGQPLPIWGRNRMYPGNIGGWRKSENMPTKVLIPDIPRQITKPLDLIKNMTLEAWKQVHETKKLINRGGVKGLGLVLMLSNLWVMGLRDEYEEGKRWIEANNRDSFLDPEYPEIFIYTSQVSTEYLGSLLSCFALTNDTIWLDRAKLVGDKLKLSFDTPTGLPYSQLGPRRKDDEPIKEWDYQGQLELSSWSSIEFAYLADITNDLDMKTKVHKAQTFLENIQKLNLHHNSVHVETGRAREDVWPSPSNQFYPNLLKSFIQSNGRDDQSIQLYSEALDYFVKNLTKNHKKYNRDSNLIYEYPDGYKQSIRCSLGAMLALGATVMQRQLDQKSNATIQEQTRIEQHWRLSKEITESCHIAYTKTKTKLTSTETFEAAAEITESYFVLWRITNETKYRDYAWELIRAIHKHCRTEEGRYYHLTDVEQEYSRNNYRQPRDLNSLATTLKFMYLIFSEDILLPFDQWVFNQVGQPLPIRGQNPVYPAYKCK